MPRINKRNIDRKTNKPSPFRTESPLPDQILNRSEQIRRDDDIIRTTQRTVYDIDYALKWYIENEIRPQIEADKQLLSVPVIFSNGEKWDNVRRLGYLRDEKGMLQSPLIMLKRNTVSEKDTQRTLDVNRGYPGNYFVHKSKYNSRNKYEDELFPIPNTPPANSEKIYVVDIPKYVTVEYDMMLWCDFTSQLNSLVDQILPYGRFSWGNEGNKFPTAMGAINFETVNTIGEDRLVRATIPLTVQGTLLSAQEARKSTLRKMYSVKKLTFEQVIDVDVDIFSTTVVPPQLLQSQNVLVSGGSVVVSGGGGGSTTIDATTMAYLTNLTDQFATYVSATTVAVSAIAATNPVTSLSATKNEFDIYINGQYIDKVAYTWTPSNTASQTIIFDTTILGYDIDSNDIIVVNGRWA